MNSSAVLLLAPFPGETLSVPYLGYEPVDIMVQRALHELEANKIRVDSPTLRTFFNGVAIDDWSRTIDDCKIYGNVITLDFDQIPEDEEVGHFPIDVVTCVGHTISFTVSSSVRVGKIKGAIQDRQGISPERQRLIHEGKSLNRMDSRLGAFNIRKGDRIYLMVELKGGGCANFADLEKAALQKLAFSDDAPPGRVVCEGMNIEVKCPCTPTHRVICEQDFGLYELGKDALQCPLCDGKQVQPVTVGFIKCEYRAHGLKEDGSQFSTDWITVNDDHYSLYDPAEQTTWNRLAIEARPLWSTHEKEMCIICLKSLKEVLKNNIHASTCKHHFHDKCIDSWHGTCPVCRAARL